MNGADSEKLAAVLEERGYELAEGIEEADLVVINSCSVRESAENRVFGLVRNLSQQERRPQIVLTGCMVGSATAPRRRYGLPQLKKRLPAVDHFIPNDTQQLQRFTTILHSVVVPGPVGEVVTEASQGNTTTLCSVVVKNLWHPVSPSSVEKGVPRSSGPGDPAEVVTIFVPIVWCPMLGGPRSVGRLRRLLVR